MVTILKATFDTTGVEEVIAAQAGVVYNIVGISMCNNSTDEGRVHLREDTTTELYGGGSGNIYIAPEASWGLPMSDESVAHPYWILGTNHNFLIYSQGGARVSGTVWYFES